MRVSVLNGPKDVALVDRPVPRPGPSHVLVRVASVGVCGSDTHYYDHGRIGRFVVDGPWCWGTRRPARSPRSARRCPSGGSGSGCPSSPGCPT